MKAIGKRLLTAVLVAALVVTVLPTVSAKAATAPKLSKTKVTLGVGEKKTLKVKNTPSSATITWTSSKKSVATVSKKGVVKAKKVGSAKITCKVKTAKKTYTLKCTVTVKKTKVWAYAYDYIYNTKVKNSLIGFVVWLDTTTLSDGVIKKSNVTVTENNDKKIKLTAVEQGATQYGYAKVFIWFDDLTPENNTKFTIKISGVKGYTFEDVNYTFQTDEQKMVNSVSQNLVNEFDNGYYTIGVTDLDSKSALKQAFKQEVKKHLENDSEYAEYKDQVTVTASKFTVVSTGETGEGAEWVEAEAKITVKSKSDSSVKASETVYVTFVDTKTEAGQAEVDYSIINNKLQESGGVLYGDYTLPTSADTTYGSTVTWSMEESEYAELETDGAATVLKVKQPKGSEGNQYVYLGITIKNGEAEIEEQDDIWFRIACVDAEEPTITGLEQTSYTYHLNEEAEPLTASASVTDGGTLILQWWELSSYIDDTLRLVSDATETSQASFVPDTSEAGTRRYCCIVTNYFGELGNSTSYTQVQSVIITVTVE